jgi:hypothetical protein
MKLSKLIFIACLFPFLSMAQVKEGEKFMSQGNKNALTIELPKTTFKIAEKNWKEFTKQFKPSDYKRDKKADEYFVDNAMVTSIGGANTVDMYMKFTESGENITASLWVDLGGAYVNSAEFKDKYNEAEKLLLSYGIQVAKETTKIALEKQRDEFKSLEKKQRNLESDNTGLHKDITDYQNKIKKKEIEIEKNLKEQEEMKAKVEAQRKIVEEIQKKLDGL